MKTWRNIFFWAMLTSIQSKAQENCLTEDWRWAGFGEKTGSSGVIIHDFNKDGFRDILTTNSSFFSGVETWHYWSVVLYHPGSKDYKIEHTSDLYNGISSIQVYDYNKDGNKDIWIAANGTIEIFDGNNFSRLTIKTLPGIYQTHNLIFEDLNLDHTSELIISGEYEISIFSDDLLKQICTYSHAYRVDKLLVGNVDSDSLPEIISSNELSMTVLQLEDSTLTTKWHSDHSLEPAFLGVSYIELLDYNSDGVMEIMLGNGRTFQLIDVPKKTAIWLYGDPFSSHLPAGIYDYRSDGTLDLFIHFSEHILLIVPVSLLSNKPDTLFFPYPLDNFTKNFYLYSPDNKKTIHLVSTGIYFFQVFTLDSPMIKRDWPTALPFYFSLIQEADLDQDGKKEIVTTGSMFRINSDYGGVHIIDFNQNPTLKYADLSPYGGATKDLIVENLDDDPQPEIFLQETQIGFVADGITGKVEKVYQHPSFETINAVVLDFDDDGVKEIIQGADPDIFGYKGPYLQKVNIQSGELSHPFSHVNRGVYYLTKGDTDGDLNEEIICILSPGILFRLKGSSMESFKKLEAFTPYSILVQNVDSDPQEEIIMGTLGGRIIVFDARKDEIQSNTKISDDPILAMRAVPFKPDSIFHIVFTQFRSIGFLNLRTLNLDCVTSTESNVFFGGPEGQSMAPWAAFNGPNMAVGDFNSDGFTEVVISSIHAIHHFNTNFGFVTRLNKDLNPKLKNLRFYPNPLNDQLNFEIDEQLLNSKCNLEILNSSGQLQSSQSIIFQGLSNKISVQNLTAGTYFFKLTNPRFQPLIAKFIKLPF